MMQPKKKIRPDQADVIDRLRSSMRETRRVVMQAPTGFGKTLVASTIADNALSKGKHVLFTVPALSLIDQTVEMFWHQGITEIGVIQQQHELTNWSKPVQIASIETLAKREMPKADVIMIDEVHRWYAFYEKMLCMPAFEKTPIIGLSATPWTKGLGQYFDRLVIATTTEQLIKDGRLSPFKVFAPEVHPDLDGVRSTNTINGPDYVNNELAERMVRAELVADVVETWQKRAAGLPTLLFAVNRAHAKVLQERFVAAGIPAGYQDMTTSMSERASIRRQFHDGRLQVVCNVGTLTTGVDWDVRCISLCRPTRSEMLFVQIVGRGLRTAQGKDHCLILDHSDSHLRLGFVTEIDVAHQGLHNGQSGVPNTREGVVALPKECPKCGFVKAPRTAKCPNCGATTAEHAKCDIPENAGELAELKAGKKRPKLDGDKSDIYAGLLWIVKARGYKNGWADHKYREIFGVWPRGMKYIQPQRPQCDLEEFVRREQAKWARRKRLAEQKNGNGHDRDERDEAAIRRVREQFGRPPLGSIREHDDDRRQ